MRRGADGVDVDWLWSLFTCGFLVYSSVFFDVVFPRLLLFTKLDFLAVER